MTKSAQVLSKWRGGFTLVELLVVIAIIAILAAIVILIVNPLEVTRRARDATRLADLTSVQNAINVTVQEATTTGMALLCVGTGGATGSCNGRSSEGGATASNANGTGWVRVDLTQQQAVSVPNLPLDPTNTPLATGSHYTYCGQVTATTSTWEINTNLESTRETPKESRDGGNDDSIYETGSEPGLDLIGGSGPCSY